jgi:KamA family protein
MRLGDPNDPLLLQVLPQAVESFDHDGFSQDPVGDRSASLLPGLLHKYEGRVLMVATGACAVHCRYCFRRHFPYEEAPRSLAGWSDALSRVAADSSIQEVILSGGDPLMLVDDSLATLAQAIATSAHVRRLRIHTPLPVVIPERRPPTHVDARKA